MLLDSVENVHAVLAVDHVHGQAPLAKAASAPDPVQVGLVVRVPILVHWKVEVDDNRHLLNVDTCTKERWETVRWERTNPCCSPTGGPRTPASGASSLGGLALGFGDKGTQQNPEVTHRALAGAKKITESVGEPLLDQVSRDELKPQWLPREEQALFSTSQMPALFLPPSQDSGLL